VCVIFLSEICRKLPGGACNLPVHYVTSLALFMGARTEYQTQNSLSTIFLEIPTFFCDLRILSTKYYENLMNLADLTTDSTKGF